MENHSFKCIGCASTTKDFIGSFGDVPNCNYYVSEQNKAKLLSRYPLELVLCTSCKLLQIGHEISYAEIFNDDYPYFSSCSTSWLTHSRNATDHYQSTFSLTPDCGILEIGSNDGYFLKNWSNFSRVIGVEPCLGPAYASEKLGIKTYKDFFSKKLANHIGSVDGVNFDLIVSNNMMAHTPNLEDVLDGVKYLLSDRGNFVVEVQNAVEMVLEGKFDTTYHEHFSYFTITSACNVFKANGLFIYDVEKLPTHGGSIRLYAQKNRDAKPTARLIKLLKEEEALNVGNESFYKNIFLLAAESKKSINIALRNHKQFVAYGAPTKGNVFINYCGLDERHIKFTSDMSEYKQGKFMPGSGIPVLKPSKELYENESKILILPWNLADEIVEQFKDWGVSAELYVAVPKFERIYP